MGILRYLSMSESPRGSILAKQEKIIKRRPVGVLEGSFVIRRNGSAFRYPTMLMAPQAVAS
jgi:hypothetical protein